MAVETTPNSTAGNGNEVKPALGTTPSAELNKGTPTTETKAGTENVENKTAPAATTENKGEGGKTTEDDKTDYKVKFSESTREAQRLMEVLKAAGIDPATGKPIAAPETKPGSETVEATKTRTQTQPQNIPLTDDVLAKAIPGFANLPEEQKALIRDTKQTVKLISDLKNQVAELFDEREYNNQFKALIKKEEFKSLADLAEEFKEFAYKDENLQIPLTTVAAAFLHAKSEAAKAEEAKKVEQPTGLEAGGAGKGEAKKGNEDGFTAEEAEQIRKNDPKRYQTLIRTGKWKIREG